MEPQTNTTPPSPQDASQTTPGSRLDSPSTIIPPQSAGSSNQSPEVKIKKKRKYVKQLLVVVLCEILIGAGIAAYFWRDNLAIQQQNAYIEIIQDLKDELDEIKAQLEDDDPESGMDPEGEFDPSSEFDDFSTY